MMYLGMNRQTGRALTVGDSALNDESVRPVAERVTVQGAEIFSYRVEARLHLFDSVVAGPCLDAADAAFATYLKQARLGRSLHQDSYGAVLRLAGVDWVEITELACDIIMDRTQAGYCTGTLVTVL